MLHLRHLNPARLHRRKKLKEVDTSRRYNDASPQLSSSSRDSGVDMTGHSRSRSVSPTWICEDAAWMSGAASDGASTLCGTASVASGRYSEELMAQKADIRQLPSESPYYDDLYYSSDEEQKPAYPEPLRPFGSEFKTEPTPLVMWNNMLPWLMSNFDSILGDNNPGAIDLLQGSETPTICITAENTSLVNRRPLDQKLAGHARFRFKIDIRQGIVSRTNKRREAQKLRWPAQNSNFYQFPKCGASIGVDESDDVGSFGGFIQLQFTEGKEWHLMGLTSHHILEERTALTIPGRGVVSGMLRGTEFRISQPAALHIEEERYQLKRHLKINEALTERLWNQRDEGASLRLLRQRESILAQLSQLSRLTPDATHFGRVFHSSGYGVMVDNHQMDWALISSIPSSRSTTSNVVPSYPAPNMPFDPTTTSLTNICPPTHFTAISTLFPHLSSPHVTPPEPLARIHGCGAISGAQSGFLSGLQSIVKLGRFDSPSLEWSFAPYHTLGTHGDSGAWIFSDFGEVVGMIMGSNETTGLTYFTPMHVVLRDIKEKTGAINVRIAKWDLPEGFKLGATGSGARAVRIPTRDSGIDVESRRTSFATMQSNRSPPFRPVDLDETTLEFETLGLNLNGDTDADVGAPQRGCISRASSEALGTQMIPEPFPIRTPKSPPKSHLVPDRSRASSRNSDISSTSIAASSSSSSSPPSGRRANHGDEKPLPPPPKGSVNIIHDIPSSHPHIGSGSRVSRHA